MTTIYDFTAQTLDGRDTALSEFRGKTLLIVNTASKCGFTPQYAGLQSLYDAYKDRGFVVLGFPCNQFGNQEPGDESEIGAFCERNYGVGFPMFAKIDVNGPNAHPIYEHLKREAPGVLGSKAIKWNFTKFLVDREGHIVGRFAPMTKPDDLRAAVEKLL